MSEVKAAEAREPDDDLPAVVSDLLIIQPSEINPEPGPTSSDPNNNLACVGAICEIKPAAEISDNLATKKKKKAGGSSAFIQTIHSQQELSTLLESSSSKAGGTVIVEFMTTWCGACAGIAPLYEALSQSAAEEAEEQGPLLIQAAQVICDKTKETKKIAASFSVGSYPVFVVFENGRESSRWNGADRGKLEKAFERASGGARRRGGGKGKKKGGGGRK